MSTDSEGDSTVLLSDISKGTTIRASSVLQKKIKLYGPKNAIDTSNVSSSWNSEGLNDDDDERQQHLLLDFGGRFVDPTSIKIQYQAGFGCELCTIYLYNSATNKTTNENLINEIELHTQDIHDVQTFDLPSSPVITFQDQYTTKMKIVFQQLADFYGRIIVYSIEVWGIEIGTISNINP